MTQNTLSLLGCPGSLVFLLLIGNAAQADTIVPQSESLAPVVPVAQSTELAGREVIFEAPQANPRMIAIDPNSDTVGDLAIAKFKCDCPPCRMAVVQLLQTGQLSL